MSVTVKPFPVWTDQSKLLVTLSNASFSGTASWRFRFFCVNLFFDITHQSSLISAALRMNISPNVEISLFRFRFHHKTSLVVERRLRLSHHKVGGNVIGIGLMSESRTTTVIVSGIRQGTACSGPILTKPIDSAAPFMPTNAITHKNKRIDRFIDSYLSSTLPSGRAF